MLKLIFWVLVAADLAGIVLWYLLGLAAAVSARSSPAAVTLLLLVLPALLLGGAALLFVKATATGWRLVAVLLAAAPLLLLVSGRALAEARFRSALDDTGRMTFFRAGPSRELAQAISRNDSARVAELISTVDVNASGLDGVTPLLLALRQLRRDPERQAVLGLLLDAGADPNRGAQAELPLGVALQVARATGPEPVRRLLQAGADPNQRDEFDVPVFFGATGQSAGPEVMGLLLDHGADPGLEARGRGTALISTANSRNWAVALLLLERGADPDHGRSVNGHSFRAMVEQLGDAPDPDGALAAVRRHLAGGR